MSTLSAIVPAETSSPNRRWLRRSFIGAGAATLVTMTACRSGGLTALGQRPDADRRHRMERSPLWRDGKFRNPQPLWTDYGKAIRAGLRSVPHSRPTQPVPIVRVDPARLEVAPNSGLRITWLGHSTALIEIDGFRVLTDPVWGERASPVDLVGSQRWYAPPLALADLPAVDAVVISHDHYDHLDHRTIAALKNRRTTFIVPLGVGAHLAFWGVPEERIVELDWWETKRVGGLEITSTPARHASGRGLFDKDLTLWSGYALVGPKHRVYFSGDTGMQDAFADIARRFGPFDATLIEIGAYNATWPDWHIGPEQAVTAHRVVQGKVLIPIHWGLFNLAPHSWTEPIERVLVAAARGGAKVATPRPGEGVEPGRPLVTKRWWPEVSWSPAENTPIVSTRSGVLSAADSYLPQ